MDEFTERLSAQLQIEEGVKLHLYHDSKGILTGGVGRNMNNGFSADEVELMLANDIKANITFMSKYEWWSSLNDPRRAAVIDMCFMGVERLLHFVLMIAALVKAEKFEGAGMAEAAAKSYAEAKAQVLNSQWFKDVGPVRGNRVADMIETGNWPPDIPFKGVTSP